MTTALLTQSNYIPWRGYFDAIHRADVFVMYDSVQYTRRDWRNRNRIKTSTGTRWLTIPVQTKGNFHQPIDQISVADHDWADRHWRTIRQEYAQAPYLTHYADEFARLWGEAGRLQYLSDINELFLRGLCNILGIRTDIRRSREFEANPSADRTQKLVDICVDLNADRYLSGPAAEAYLDESMFEEAGIDVEWLDYSGYSEYVQLHGSFVPGVSIVDLVLNEGDNATRFMKIGGFSG